jgi:hypothetical protein
MLESRHRLAVCIATLRPDFMDRTYYTKYSVFMPGPDNDPGYWFLGAEHYNQLDRQHLCTSCHDLLADFA